MPIRTCPTYYASSYPWPIFLYYAMKLTCRFHHMMRMGSGRLFEPYSVADPRGRQGCSPPLGQNSFIFMQFSSRSLRSNRFAHYPRGWRPLGNPGSANGTFWINNKWSICFKNMKCTDVALRSRNNTSEWKWMIAITLLIRLNSFPHFVFLIHIITFHHC